MSENLTETGPTLFGLIETCYTEPDLEKAGEACQLLNGHILLDGIRSVLQADSKYKLLLETLESVPEFLPLHYAGLRVLVALSANRGELLKKAGAEVVEPLLYIWQAKVRLLSSRARLTLRRLRGREARETMCELALQENQYLMRSVVLEAGFFPQEMRKRVLFFFLTAQWRPYEGLDFDHRQIKAIYDAADQRLKQRILTVARKAGRPELIPVIMGANQPKRLLKNADWELLVNSLSEGKRWEEAWEIAKIAPAMHAVKLVKLLAQSGWQPVAEAEQLLLQDLFACTENLATDRFPFVPGYEPVFEYQLPFFDEIREVSDKPPKFAVSRDCRFAAAIRADSSVEVWNLRETQRIAVFSLENLLAAAGAYPETFAVRKVALSPDGSWLTLIYEFGPPLLADYNFMSIHIASRQIHNQQHSQFNGFRFIPVNELYYSHTGVLLTDYLETAQLAFSPGGSYVVAVIGFIVHVWQLDNPYAVNILVKTLAWQDRLLMQNNSLVFKTNEAGFFGFSQEFDAVKWVNKRKVPFYPFYSGSRGAYSNDNQQLVFVYSGDSLRYWADATAAPEEAIHAPPPTVMRQTEIPESFSAIITPDKKYFITGHRNLLMFWALPGLELVNVVNAHFGPIRELFFARDDFTLISIGDDSKIKYWNSYLYRLAEKPLEKIIPTDVETIRQFKTAMSVDATGRAWLNFLETYLYRRIQHAIEIGDFSSGFVAQEADIELELE